MRSLPFCLVIQLVVLAATAQQTVQVTRGPYLQLGTRTNIIVRWRTDLPSDTVVRYGDSVTNLNFTASNLELTNEHQLTLQNLHPDRSYFYSIGTSLETLAGDSSFFFKTAPQFPKPTRIWVVGDPGTVSEGRGNTRGVRDSYYRYARSRYTDVWLMLGDNAYGEGEDWQYQKAMFEVFHDMLRQTPAWGTIGNHETYSVDPDGFPYFRIFTLPTQGEAGGFPSGTENYYSFDYSNIHFVCLDSEISNRTPEGEMAQWLQNDLAANTNQWLIAFWHSPPYSKGSHDSDYIWDSDGRLIQMRETFVPILEAHGVDLVLCGHSHAYERSFLLDGHYGFSDTLSPAHFVDPSTGRREENGPYLKRATNLVANEGAVYVVAGSAGQISSSTNLHPAMCVTWRRMGSLSIDVTENQLDAIFIQDDGTIGDRFAIVKGIDPDPAWLSNLWMTNGSAVLRWRSEAGKRYIIEQSDDLAQTWRRIGEPITAANRFTTWTNALRSEDLSAYFRVFPLKD